MSPSKSFPALLALLPAVTLLPACGFDLSLPEQPQRGSLIGSVDTGGNLPAAGNAVVLVDEDGSKQSQATDGDGAFAFGDLRPGVYYLELALPGFERYVQPGVRIRPGQRTDLGPLAPKWLANTPAEAIVTGKAVGGGGGSLAGGEVQFILEPAKHQVAKAIVGSDGEFLQAVPPGQYTLKVLHPLYVTATVSELIVGEGQRKDLSATPIVLDINPATVTGTVSIEQDGQSSGPAVGALITVVEDGATTTTDATGAFTLGGLVAGQKTVRVTLSGFHDPIGAHPVLLSPGKPSALPTIALALNRGDISGTVVMADGQPAQDVTISLTGTPYSASLSQSASDPSRGTFRIQDVPVGTYALVASRARYSRAQVASVVVSADTTVSVGELTLVLLQGRVGIDDADPSNSPGYVRSPQVNLAFSDFVNAASFRASEDPTFQGVAFGGYSGATQPFTLSATDGVHTVFVQYKDASGAISDVFQGKVILDRVAPANPQVAILSSSGFTRFPDRFQLQLAASDATSTVRKVRIAESLDGQGDVPGTARDYAALVRFDRVEDGDGVKTVHVQFIDDAGNVSAVASANVVVDTLAPAGSIAIERGERAVVAGYTNSLIAIVTETLTSEGDGGTTGPDGGTTGITVRLANSVAGLTAAPPEGVQAARTWLLDPTGEGSKTVHAIFEDLAGNRSDVITGSIIYDKTPPSPATLTLLGSAATSNPLVQLGVAAQDTVGLGDDQALTLSEDPLFKDTTTVAPAAMPANGQRGFTLSSGDGQKQVYARYRDLAGNDSVASVAVTLDTLAPTGAFSIEGTLADGTRSSTLTATPNVLLTISQSGATHFAVGDETLTSCAGATYDPITSQTLSHTLGGTAVPREVRLCLRDAALNVFGPIVRTIALDPAAPAGCALSLQGSKTDGTAAPAGLTASRSVTATIAGCNETPADMFLSSSPVTCTTSASFAWTGYFAQTSRTLEGPEGTNELHGCVRDRAGNVAAIQLGTIQLDTTRPTLASISPVDGAITSAGTISLAVSATDTHGFDLASGLTVSEDPLFRAAGTVGPQPLPSDGRVSLSLSPGDGEKRIHARFRDRVGNETFVSTVVVRDTLAPTGAFVILGTLADGTSSTTHTSAPSVQLQVSHTGASAYLLSDASLTTCPATGYTALPGGTIPYSFSSPGAKELRMCLVDAAGNKVGPLSATIIHDGQAPTGCAATVTGSSVGGAPAPAGLTASREVRAQVASCLEAPTEVFFTTGAITCSANMVVDWTPATAPAPLTVSGADGSKAVNGCVRDAARNVAAVAPGSILLDTTPPTGLTLGLGAAATNQATLTVSVGGADPNGLHPTQALTLSESPLFSGATTVGPRAFVGSLPFTLSSAEGQKTVNLRLRDAVGNDATASATILYDVSSPSGSFTIVGALRDGTPSSTVTTTADVTLQLQHNGASHYLVSDETLTTCPATGYTALGGTVSYALTSANNPRTVHVCLRDPAGNVSSVLTGSIAFDAAPVTGCAVALQGLTVTGQIAPAGLTAQQSVHASVTGCAEQPAEVAFLHAATDPDCSSTSIRWTQLTTSQQLLVSSGDGSKRVTACVRDQARNPSLATATSIQLDTTAPAVTVGAQAPVAGPPPLTNQTSVTLNLTATDDHGLDPAAALSGSEDGFATTPLPPQPFASQVSFPMGDWDGTHTIAVRVRDAVGNAGGAQVLVVRDRSEPSGATVTLLGTLADGSRSPEVTSSLQVDVQVAAAPDVAAYSLGTEALAGCGAVSWTNVAPVNGAFTTSSTLSGAPTGEIRVCLKDTAGNITAAPAVGRIAYRSAAPSGCVLTVTLTRADGTPSLTQETARTAVPARITGCAELPAEAFVTSAKAPPAACSAAMSAPWKAYSDDARGESFQQVLAYGDGQYQLGGCVRDAARNVAAIAVRTVTLDTTAPQGLSVAVAGGEAYINAARAAQDTAPDRLDAGFIRTTVTATALGAATQWLVSADGVSDGGWETVTGGSKDVELVGETTHSVSVTFRDAVGNESSPLTDTVIVDTTPPAADAGVLVFEAPTGNVSSALGAMGELRTNANALVIHATAQPDDGRQLEFGDTTATKACPETVYANPTRLSRSSQYGHSVPQTEATHFVCARWLDEAGNPSASIVTAVAYDRTPPALPQMLTHGTYLNPGTDLSYVVRIGKAPPDANHWKWQIAAPTLATWTDAVPVEEADALAFTFTLKVDGLLQNGLPNLMQVREVDMAGNPGPEAAVTIVTDTLPPPQLELQNGWVNNQNGQGTIYWRRNDPTGDTVGFKVYYGAAQGNAGGWPEPTGYFGAYAAEGNSPVTIGNFDSTKLSGLPNGTTTYLTVRPVDRAGNVGSGYAEVQIQSSEVSPNLIHELHVFSGVYGRAWKTVIGEDHAYVFGTNGSNGCGAGSDNQFEIVPVDISRLESPIQRGAIQASPPAPPPLGTAAVVAADPTCSVYYADIAIDGQYLFTITRTLFKIFSLKIPSAPALVTSIDLAAAGLDTSAETLTVRGGLAFAAGDGSTARVVALDLADLYDDDSGTVPDIGDVVGTATAAPWGPGTLAVVRDRLIVPGRADGNAAYFSISDLFATPRATWDNADYLSSSYLSQALSAPIASGNYLFASDGRFAKTSIFDIHDFLAGASNTPGTPFQGLAHGADRDFVLAGPHLILPSEGDGIRIADASSPAAIRDVGLYKQSPGTRSLGLYGNYGVGVSSGGRLRIYELAVPTSLRTHHAVSGASQAITVGPGFVFNGGGPVQDLLAGGAPKNRSNTVADRCALDVTRFDEETVVTASGAKLYQHDLRIQLDRSNAVTWTPTTDYSELQRAGLRVTGVKAYGNYLIVAETRDSTWTDGPGVFIEVFDARKLRDGRTDTWLSGTDAIATLKVSSEFQADLGASIDVSRGRAVLALARHYDSGGITDNLLFVDLRAALDDDETTALGAASVQGTLALGLFAPAFQARTAILRGSLAYVVGGYGFSIIDASKALDESDATVVTTSDVLSTTSLPSGGAGVDAFGGYAIVVPANGQVAGAAVKAFDVSRPTEPRVISSLPWGLPSRSCYATGDGWGVIPLSGGASVKIVGAQAYIGAPEHLEVVGLE